MTLSKKTVGLIIGLIVVSLSGLLVLQLLLLDYTMGLKEQAFQRNVLASMGVVSQKLATRELMDVALLRRTISGMGSQSNDSVLANIRVINGVTDTSIEKEIFIVNGDTIFDTLVKVQDGSLFYNVISPQRMNNAENYFFNAQERTVVDSFALPGSHRPELNANRFAEEQYLWKYQADEMTVFMEIGNSPQGLQSLPVNDSVHYSMFMTIIGNMLTDENEPLEDRVSIETLDSLIHTSLNDYSIDIEYAFAVKSASKDSINIINDSSYKSELLVSPYRAQLFPQTLFSSNYELLLHFPGKQMFLLRQTGLMMLLMVVFVIIITGCFIYTIRTIIRQKRFSSQMVEFINNMTHEFKTPISTVKLACEAIMRPDVLREEERIVRYGEMIQSENQRMSNQAEKILQMAVLEEGDYNLSLSDVDIHAAIHKAVTTERLHVENRRGTIRLDLQAKRNMISADELHISNIIGNLLDNANKYSPQAPEILVSTKNIDHDVLIIIEDKGRGIKKSDQKFIFDKYFRVSSGNVHDVKGFGLGLSYVKLMTEAMNGVIVLKSEAGSGTRITISFPTSTVSGESNGQ
ncbi:MAG: HAMP domain-containing histidine kinase [candidate division Zixibacteria bacterium]|nr:HAMP domain-containing histidine kinase [candidate division Zixibacteria bacterium]